MSSSLAAGGSCRRNMSLLHSSDQADSLQVWLQDSQCHWLVGSTDSRTGSGVPQFGQEGPENPASSLVAVGACERMSCAAL